MITSFKVTHFKCFRDLTIPLTRITLLGGQNGVGKTSLLEALFLPFDRMNPQMINRLYAWRGVPLVSLDPAQMFAPLFLDYDMHQEVVLSSVVDGVEERMVLSLNRSYLPPAHRARPVSPNEGALPAQTDRAFEPGFALDVRFEVGRASPQVAHLRPHPHGMTLHVDFAEFRGRPATFLTARGQRDPNDDSQRYGSLDIRGKQDSILPFLRIIEGRLRSLSAVPVGDVSVLHGDVGLERKLPIAHMGDGLSRLLSIVLAIATSEKGLVLVDEFENGIHYSAMSSVWRGMSAAAREFDTQVVGTTHSYECLKAAHEGLANGSEDDFTYIRLDNEDGRIVPKVYSHATLGAALQAGWEVR